MDGIVLAGGLGTRLYPVTREIPKALIPIQGKPLTDHVFDVLYRAEVDRVILSLGYMHDSVLQRYTPQYSGQWESESYVMPTQWVRDNQNGTAAWIKMIESKNLDLTQEFIVVNGDNLCAVDFSKVIEFHRSRQAEITIVLKEVEEVSALGVAHMDGDQIKNFVEKPKPGTEPSKLISTGYYVFSKSALSHVKDLFPQGDLEDQDWHVMLEHHVFPKIASMGKLYGYSCHDLWFDTGTFERWSQVIDQWKLTSGTYTRY